MILKYFEKRFFVLYLIPFIIGILTVFSYQPFNLSILNFFVLPLFFYFIVYIKKKSRAKYRIKPYKKNLFIFGTAFGFGYYFSGLYWITNSLTFDETFKILIPFGLILIPLFLSIFFSISILIIGPYLKYNFTSIFLFSGTLALADFVRAKILTGFPWNIWSYSFSWSTEIIQIVNKIGFFAFNLIIITIFTLPVVVFFKLSLGKKFLSFFFLICILFSFYIFGNHSINKNKSSLNEVNEKFYVKVVSPNFDLLYGLDDNQIKKRFNKLIKYSSPKSDKKTLFIWPEGVFSGYSFSEIQFLKESFYNNFSEKHFIIFGVNIYDRKNNGYFNSLIVVNNNLEIIQEYKKQKLVPFGEFLPFEKKLRKLGLKKITEGYGSFLKGSKQNNLIVENMNILPLICYEIIFTKLSQQSNKKTNLIVNISEDGWFGKTIGPYQHFAKSIFRAIEQNTYLVRSANKGISAIINNKGEIVKKLNSNEAGNIELEVPLIISENKNKNDLIFFILLITYILIFLILKKNDNK